MAQAKVLTEAELKRALAVVAGRRHAEWDRVALLLPHCRIRRWNSVAAMGVAVCAVGALWQPASAWPWWGASEPLGRGAQALQQLPA